MQKNGNEEKKKMQEKNKYFFTAKVIAKNKIFFDEIDSTQKKARELAEKKVENGTIIITDYQTNGIGTHNRSWYHEKGKNIAFSLILYPKCKINMLESLTIDIAKIMQHVIEELYEVKLEIKKPNDLIYHKKKVGGILTQIVTNGENIKYLIIGIGMNINSTNFPEELQKIATSLKLEFGKEFSREKIISVFCNGLENYCIEKKIF